MTRIVLSLLFIAATLANVSQPSLASVQKRSRPGSFVFFMAPSVNSLVNQITNNRMVARRYSTHYGMPADDIAKYFRENLETKALSKPTAVTTYFVSENGRILSKTKTLPAGTLVFTSKSGELLLEAQCGNPLTRALPKVPITKVLSMPEVVGTPPEAVDALIPPPVEALPETVPVTEPMMAMAINAAPFLAPATDAIAPSLATFAGLVVPALVGAVAVRGDNDTPPPVPEPGCCLPVALGALAGLGVWKRRRL